MTGPVSETKKQPRIVGLLTARGGSKGLPDKNILPLAGKPLILWSIDAVQAVGRVDFTICSTDSERIAAVVRGAGCEVPFLRPPHLATDDALHIDVVEHAIEWLKNNRGITDEDVLLLLQPTSPLRTARDLREAIETFLKSGAPALQSVSPAKPRPSLARKITEGGILQPYFDTQTIGKPRHAVEPGYFENGAIYLNRIGALLESRVFQVPGSVAYIMPPERSIDIDSKHDFQIAEYLLTSNS